MDKMKFGFGQFWEHAPKIIKQIRVGLVSFIGGSLIYTHDISCWLGITEHTLNTIFGISLLAITAILNMFGIKPDDSETTTKTEQ